MASLLRRAFECCPDLVPEHRPKARPEVALHLRSTDGTRSASSFKPSSPMAPRPLPGKLPRKPQLGTVERLQVLAAPAKYAPWRHIKQSRTWHRLPAGAHRQDACATSFNCGFWDYGTCV